MNLSYQPPVISGKKQEDYAKALEDYLALNKEDVEYWFNQIEKSTEKIVKDAGNGNLFKLPVATKETLGGTMPQDDFTLDEYGKMSINLALLKSKLGMTQTTTNFVVLDGRDLQETDLTGLNTVFFRVTKSTPVITSTRTNTSAFSIEKMWFEDAGGAVVEVLPTSFTMESTKSVMVGTSAIIGTTILPANCNRKALTWSAENSNVSVYNGTVTGVRIGTCRVSARTINNLVASCLVTVTDSGNIYIYRYGNECTSVTGGWISVDTSTIGIWPNQKNTQKNSDHLLAIAQTSSMIDKKASGFRSVRKINLSNYSKMVVTFYKEGHEADIYFSAFEDGRQPWTGWVSQTGSTTGGMFTKEIAINSTSEMYIFFDAADAKYSKTTAKLYEIYLEQKQE